MLTGSGVALILRVPGHAADDAWSTHAWYVFAGVAAFSLLTKYVIRYRGSHLFNPSNIGLVVAFVVLGSERVEPLDFWWAPLNGWMVTAYAVILAGGLLITTRLRLLAMAATLLDRARRRGRCARRIRALHDGALGVRARVRVRLLAGDRHVAGGADLPVLHDHRPEDGARRARRPRRVRRPRRRGQHAADGAADRRVRDQGRPARRPRRRVRGAARARPRLVPPARPARRRRPSARGCASGARVGAVAVVVASASASSPPARRRAGRRRPGRRRRPRPRARTRSTRRRSRRSPSSRTSPDWNHEIAGPVAQRARARPRREPRTGEPGAARGPTPTILDGRRPRRPARRDAGSARGRRGDAA